MYYDMKASGERIHQLRISRKMTQERLSEALNITEGHLRKLEMGISGGSIDMLVDLSVYFNVSLDYLILGKIEAPNYVKSEIERVIGILTECTDKF